MLIESDKAFAPSTARYINWFHLVFESFALLSFLPEFRCITAANVCDRKSVFSHVQASMDSILGDTHAVATRGRFLLGITSLRFFGLVRHWKQMWINNTFRSEKGKGSESWLFPRGRNRTAPMALGRAMKGKKKDKMVCISTFDATLQFYVKLTTPRVSIG